MKRKLKLLLVLTCLFMLGGCGKSEGGEPKDEIVTATEAEESTIGEGLATPIPDTHESKSNVSESTDVPDRVEVEDIPKEKPTSDSTSTDLAKELIDKQSKDVECGCIGLNLISDITMASDYEGEEIEESINIEIDLTVDFDKDTYAIDGYLGANIFDDNQVIALKQYMQIGDTYYVTYDYDSEEDEWYGWKESIEYNTLDIGTILNVFSSDIFKDLTLESTGDEYIVKGTIDYKSLNNSTELDLSDFNLEDLDEDILALVATMTFDKDTEVIKSIEFGIDYNTVVVNDFAEMYGINDLSVDNFSFVITFEHLGDESFVVEIPVDIIENTSLFDYTVPNQDVIGEDTHETYEDDSLGLLEDMGTFKIDGVSYTVGDFTLGDFLTDGWAIDNKWSSVYAGDMIPANTEVEVSLKNESMHVIWFDVVVKNNSDSDIAVESCDVIGVYLDETLGIKSLNLPCTLRFFDSYSVIKNCFGEADDESYYSYVMANDYEGEATSYVWNYDDYIVECIIVDGTGLYKVFIKYVG